MCNSLGQDRRSRILLESGVKKSSSRCAAMLALSPRSYKCYVWYRYIYIYIYIYIIIHKYIIYIYSLYYSHIYPHNSTYNTQAQSRPGNCRFQVEHALLGQLKCIHIFQAAQGGASSRLHAPDAKGLLDLAEWFQSSFFDRYGWCW